MRTDALYKFKIDRVNLKLIISPNVEIKKNERKEIKKIIKKERKTFIWNIKLNLTF